MTLWTVLDVATALLGDRQVLTYRDQRLTAEQLADRARRGATVVRERGAGTLVHLAPSDLAMPTALFAAAHAGVPFAPLNYRSSREQVAALLGRLVAPLVVCDESFVESLLPPDVDHLTTSEWLRACESAPQADDDASPSTAAVLLFTSGTTSEPKCAVLSHDNLLSYVLQTVDPASAAEDDAALVSVPPYHVAGVGTLLTNIYAGRRLVYLPNFDPQSWLQVVRDERITFAMLVPTMLQRIVEHLDGAPAGTPTLRSLAYGGAKMPAPVLLRALQVFPEVDFVNAYGLTETSSTIAVLGPEDHRAALAADPRARARLGSVGRLVPGIEGEIRSPEGGVLGADEEGELWVRGPQVSGSYDGIGSVLDDQGWFPTRDRAYLDDDGYLFVIGRADDTIIRGGENIAPAEIEDVLLSHPDVAEAAVIGLPDEEWGERLVAAVVLRPGAQRDAERIRAFVREHLRASKTPAEIWFRDALPYTATGKLLRRQIVQDTTTAQGA